MKTSLGLFYIQYIQGVPQIWHSRFILDCFSAWPAGRSEQPSQADWLLNYEYGTVLARIIITRDVRRIIVDLVIATDEASTLPSNVAAAISHAGKYLKVGRLRGFQMVWWNVVSTTAPILAQISCGAEEIIFPTCFIKEVWPWCAVH